jgi:glucan phosphoethanolaminetransferase (alkaline phosphatase superfamily)
MLPVIGAFVAYVWMAWRLPAVAIFKGWSYRIARLLLVAVIPLAAYASFDSNELIDGAALNPVVGSFMFFGGQMPRIYAQLHGSLTNKIPYHAKRMDRSEEVHVLVVGESARRGSWSVYGYSRPTTPYLNSLKARGEAIFFQDVMADANLTQNAVPIILTGIPPGRILNANISGNLFDLAREAGYSTAWLVNQDIEITMLAGVSVDPLETPPDPRPSLFGRVLQDATLLPVYRREIGRTGTARFIGLHVMGSHWEYYKRYPSTFERFGNADGLGAASIMFNNLAVEKALVGTYDNSVLYTDWFLGQIIDEARKLAVPATVTFVPDHGEDLAEFDGGSAGHGDPSYQPSQFKIPAFIWANEGYRRAHPQIIEAIQRNASAEIRSRNIFYAMADIMGITWPAQQPAQSYASPRFVPDASGPLLAGGVLVPAPQ